MLGKHHTEETKKKMSESAKGKLHPWALNNPQIWKKGHKINLGKKRPGIGGVKKGNIPWNKGKKGLFKWTEKQKIQRSEMFKGEKNPMWKGGISPINNLIRGSLEYKLWEDSIKNKNCNCCQKCNDNRPRQLVAHHILNFSQFPELRFAIDNGITFCKQCHKLFHEIYGKKKNTLEQVLDFLNNNL